MNSISRHFLKEIFRIIKKFIFSPNTPYNIKKIGNHNLSAIEYLHEFNNKKKIDQKCRLLVIKGLHFKGVE